MAEKECVKCGTTYNEEDDGWYYCPECESAYCPECIEDLEKEQDKLRRIDEEEKIKQKKEKERMEKIPEADLDTYKQLICPRCNTEMMPF